MRACTHDGGVLPPGYAGAPQGSPDSMSAWEYTLLMHQTQFAPVPAGGSPEQFRLWEALEAGAGAHARALSSIAVLVLQVRHLSYGLPCQSRSAAARSKSGWGRRSRQVGAARVGAPLHVAVLVLC